MKSFLAIVMTVLMALAPCVSQNIPNPPPQNLTPSAVAGPAGIVTTPSGLLINVAPGPIFCQGDMGMIGAVQFALQANQNYHVVFDCARNLVLAQQFAASGPQQVELATVAVGASTVGTITNLSVASQFPATQDATYIILPTDCNLTIGATGTFAAAVLTGTGNGGSNPGPFRVAAGQTVLQGVTTAAANNVNVTCDLTPPSKLNVGKGVTINNVQLFYGVQTTALTSITAPTIQSLTYPATGAAAGVTSAAAGGVLTVLPASLQLTTTTSGQCFSENIALGTPVPVVTDLQRITLDQVFNQTGAAATTLQICGAIVHYTNIPL